MAWVYLIIAAIFELGWPLGFKLSDLHPERFRLFIGGSVACMLLSGIFLYIAQKAIPISTAYIVWTGIGALGTLIIGIVFFGDSASFLRLFFAFLILVGVVGLEVITKYILDNWFKMGPNVFWTKLVHCQPIQFVF